MRNREDLNRRLWMLLGLKVMDGTVLARDGVTWLHTFLRAEDGFADVPPNLVCDLNAVVKYIPKDVQFVLRWSVYAEKWSCLLTRTRTGEFLAECYAEHEAEAAALALEQLLTRTCFKEAQPAHITVLNT